MLSYYILVAVKSVIFHHRCIQFGAGSGYPDPLALIYDTMGV